MGLVDNDMEVSRASPPRKESLLALNKLRETVDTEKRRGKQEKYMELCIRAKNNAGGHHRLCNQRYCSGAFSMDLKILHYHFLIKFFLDV
ncbi:hypothetical protein N665_0188s0353 [Sinapis alba]|nr:hypothetical protein N665_0188s0353 [Sinapis alba]